MNFNLFRKIYKENLFFIQKVREAIKLIKKCPECDADLEIPDDVISGEIVSCPDCGMDYEVVITEKGEIELRPAEIEGEDWGE